MTKESGPSRLPWYSNSGPIIIETKRAKRLQEEAAKARDAASKSLSPYAVDAIDYAPPWAADIVSKLREDHPNGLLCVNEDGPQLSFRYSRKAKQLKENAFENLEARIRLDLEVSDKGYLIRMWLTLHSHQHLGVVTGAVTEACGKFLHEAYDKIVPLSLEEIVKLKARSLKNGIQLGVPPPLLPR